MNEREISEFDFEVPSGCAWLREHSLIAGENAARPSEPWSFLPRWWRPGVSGVIDLKERWPDGPSQTRLVTFARRQDRDDYACFEVEGGRAGRVVVVHFTWSTDGYWIMSVYRDLGDWLKDIVEDVAEWAEAELSYLKRQEEELKYLKPKGAAPCEDEGNLTRAREPRESPEKPQPWSTDAIRRLRALVGRVPAAEIARELGRTEGEVQEQARLWGWSLWVRGRKKPAE
jgi:hypothetical protein